MLGLIFVRRVVLSLVHQSAFKTRRLALTPPSKPPPVVPTLPAPGTRQTRQMPSASLILLAKARRWFSDATLAGACRPRSGAPVASAAQRRCWLVGPAPVGAGEASARSPTAVRSPLRSAPLHSWPSIAYRFDDAIQLLLPKQVHGRRKPRPGGANPGHQRGLLRDNGWRRGIRQLWHGLQNHPGRQSDDATPILLPKRVA